MKDTETDDMIDAFIGLENPTECLPWRWTLQDIRDLPTKRWSDSAADAWYKEFA